MTNDPQHVPYITLGFALAVVMFYIVQVGKRMREMLVVRLKRGIFGLSAFLVKSSYRIDIPRLTLPKQLRAG